MKLSKHRVGDFVNPVSIKCGDSNYPNISGINIDKRFMPSKYVGSDTSKYSVVPPNCFAFNLMHVGRDEKIPVAFNDSSEDLVVSPAYFVFEIIDESIILPLYFYIFMSSPEFDRYAWFCTDSSIRGNLEWSRFCDIELELPDIEVQRKYVKIYEAVQKNIDAQIHGLEDFRLACGVLIEKYERQSDSVPLGNLIFQVDEKNITGENLKYYGINRDKQFMPTVANTKNLDPKKYKIIRKDRFVFSGMQTGRDECIRIGLFTEDEPVLLSPAYTTFEIIDKSMILPEYLFLLFLNPEMDRYGWFLSDGSIRSNLDWNRFIEIDIKIPSLELQKAIVNVFKVYDRRKQIITKLEVKGKSMIPLLIKGSLMRG
ncbi:MAG: restriction endonuclease subunit S [Clostridia bacterium]|nr:restriction endonuclease subunit S [Clostridia bacterium]